MTEHDDLENNPASVARSAVRTVERDDEPSDAAYWRTRSPEERLAALEAIRKEYNTWKYGPECRFRRVYRVVERS
ncbi:MAG: toxin secretion, membrane fusion protein [Bacteroidetes bacterium QS_8_64_10]|jgi:hypothetical protein|nr:MAG: toxin secretion, membrane fusion protein [Bacteroidetes bacterium QS_8_64_10]